jgi:hypothetical protein
VLHPIFVEIVRFAHVGGARASSSMRYQEPILIEADLLVA